MADRIEEAAKAIAKADGLPSWEEAHEDDREDYRMQARAADAVLREEPLRTVLKKVLLGWDHAHYDEADFQALQSALWSPLHQEEPSSKYISEDLPHATFKCMSCGSQQWPQCPTCHAMMVPVPLHSEPAKDDPVCGFCHTSTCPGASPTDVCNNPDNPMYDVCKVCGFSRGDHVPGLQFPVGVCKDIPTQEDHATMFESRRKTHPAGVAGREDVNEELIRKIVQSWFGEGQTVTLVGDKHRAMALGALRVILETALGDPTPDEVATYRLDHLSHEGYSAASHEAAMKNLFANRRKRLLAHPQADKAVPNENLMARAFANFRLAMGVNFEDMLAAVRRADASGAEEAKK
jgi:hypothetical protein